MANRPGFFQLQSPLDLLHKLDVDYTRRVSANPFDPYAAFDFFVTAEHLPDWLRGARCGFKEATKDPGRALEAVCKQLANGAKHFVAFDRYDAVDRTTVHPAARAGLMRAGASRSGDLTGHLMIHLGASEATALGRPAISTTEFAGMVLTYWKQHPAIARAEEATKQPRTDPELE